jgi:hypothetical protein
LTVCDVLYKKQPQAADDDGDGDGDGEEESDVVMEQSQDSDNEEDVREEETGSWTEEEAEPEGSFVPEIDETVKKLRAIVRIFCRSPVNNDTLQKYTKQDLGKELLLIIDCKTRWSSLLAMLQQFLVLKLVVPKALIDHAQSSLFMTESELSLVTKLVEALEIVECGVRALCQRDMTLASADQIFEFMIRKLSAQNSDFAARLSIAVETRIMERRQVGLSTLQAYLDNSTFLDSVTDGETVLSYSTRNKISKIARNLFLCLFPSKDDDDFETVQENEETETEAAEVAEDAPLPKKSKSQELSEFLAKKKVAESGRGPRNSAVEVLKTIKKEMGVYKATGKRPSSLDLVRTALLSIPPTSTEAERPFSCVGLFVTKLCTSLSDKSINNLFILRSHFLDEKKLK